MKYNYLERYNLIKIIQEAGIKIGTNLSKEAINIKLKKYEKVTIPILEIDKYEIGNSISNVFMLLSDYLESIELITKDTKLDISGEDLIKLEKAYDDLFLYVYGKNKPEKNIMENFKKEGFVENIYLNDILPKIEVLDKLNPIKDYKEIINNSKKIKNDFNEIINSIKDTPKIENKIKETIEQKFESLKEGNGFLAQNKIKNLIYHWFFHEKKLYIVKLYKTQKIQNNDCVDFSFYVSNDFYNNSVDYFIKNYQDISKFSLNAQKLDDSSGFWLKIGAIIKSFSDDFKINYFQFTGASHDEKERLNKKTSKIIIENSNNMCKAYLKANLIKNKNDLDIKNILLTDINDILEKNKIDLNKQLNELNFNSELKSLSSTLSSLQKIEDIINKNFNQICKKFKFNPPKDQEQQLKDSYEKHQEILIKRLNDVNYFKKERVIIFSFIKTLEEINIYKNDIKNNLINFNDALNKIKMQNTKFKEAIENIYSNNEDINIDYNIMISDFTKASNSNLINLNKNIAKKIIDDNKFLFYFLKIHATILKMICLKSYKKEILFQIEKSNKNNLPLNITVLIKRIEKIFSNIIKKFKITKNFYDELILLKKQIFNIVEDTSNYIKIDKEIFKDILTKTLKSISKIENIFILHKDYKSRLKTFIDSIDDSIFNNEVRLNNFIDNLNFSPILSYSLESEIINSNYQIQPGWLLSFTEKGLFSLLNTRELKYYKILIEDLKIPSDNIIYSDGIIFKI